MPLLLNLFGKKNGDLRLCTDFRWLNARTIKDAHPLPHQADALAALGGNAFFSTMDLTSGYYSVEVHEEDKRFAAFTSPFGLYEYNRLPQGLCNSPATFMRMMMSIFGDQNFLSPLCYLDDILVFAPNEQLALQRLEMVFERLKVHNLKLTPKKCHFIRSSVKFLGRTVSKDSISTDPDKLIRGDLAWEPEGHRFKSPWTSLHGGGLVAGEVPVHLLSTAEVPLSKAPNPKNLLGVHFKRAAPSLWHLSSSLHVRVFVCIPICMCICKEKNNNRVVCERFNRTFGNMIRALPPKAKHRWPQHLRSLTFSYNATVHETTGFAPFQLMFGKTPRLPVDLLFGSVLLDDQVMDYDTSVQSLRRDLAEAMRIAQVSAAKQQQR
ncbi:hypothetical protein L3Q82_010910 [Scortum barcoo]|uniref:Uncharacterized protein n=1 Tax=Scortum barcoo TaxID=214431 RepID=A0ACB8W8A9_9TELE|nr:hypothetical protein L3Q82_010910 [Scortum barcoo]